jgi:hypothetical protein
MDNESTIRPLNLSNVNFTAEILSAKEEHNF